MRVVCISVSGLEFERYNKIFVTLSIMASNLHGGIYISLKPVHGGPDMFFDFKEFVDAQTHL
ncbi:hypothetical protein BDV59DRAFT_111551 [Aspergillus ambiguus]|uniref:uncharacterized protein n=1 Tax=Aspergillus ambiguus TaxID=176160 RepID=UPI003CCCD29A